VKQTEVLAHAPKVLSEAQRAQYFEQGYLVLERFVSEDWLARLRNVTEEFVEESRTVTESDGKFDIEPDHSAAAPRLRRLMSPVEHHAVYRDFTLKGPIVDLAEDLLGPNVKYHHSKLNFKWSDGGEEVKWHQDFPFWPHTNYSPLTIGVYLDDVDDGMGPLGVIPGSHHGSLYNHFDHDGNWTGALRDEDLPRADLSKAVFLPGPAGSVTIHNSCVIHGSVPNDSPRARNLLLQTYSAGDALVLSGLVQRFPHSDKIVRGAVPEVVEMAIDPVRMPPDWSAGYTSIFALQQGEDDAAA
jgi:ectoine hydroxylase-related dioxygenase (phytanoyl-CoA dioxygenase family)